MTVKEEINEIIQNNIWWQDDDTCQISDDVADKVLKIITKKLDKEKTWWKETDMVLGNIVVYAFEEFKKELEK